MSPAMDLPRQIQAILSEKLLIRVESLDSDLVAAGVMDSLAFTRLLMQLEEHFGFNVAMEELGIEDFRSINAIARLVADHKQASTATDIVGES